MAWSSSRETTVKDALHGTVRRKHAHGTNLESTTPRLSPLPPPLRCRGNITLHVRKETSKSDHFELYGKVDSPLYAFSPPQNGAITHSLSTNFGPSRSSSCNERIWQGNIRQDMRRLGDNRLSFGN